MSPASSASVRARPLWAWATSMRRLRITRASRQAARGSHARVIGTTTCSTPMARQRSGQTSPAGVATVT